MEAEKMRPHDSGAALRIESFHGWLPSLNLREVWQRRELLYFMVWRDLKVRYKQTALGAAWAIIQPFTTMIIFSIVFSTLAKFPSDGLPYPIFSYCALLPWNYFAGSLTRVTQSVVSAGGLIKKIYFPRLIVPLSGVLSGLADFLIAFVVLVGMMVWYGITPTWGILALPIFLLLSMMTSLSVGLWLAALNARYRDVSYAVPFVIQSWLYATPVAYPVSLIPEKWRLLYSLNPMTGVIEGFRWALLGKDHPDFSVIAVGALAIVALFIGGLYFFKRMELEFADII